MMTIITRLMFPRGQEDQWPEEFPDEMDQLQVMGFSDRAANRAALEGTKGDMWAAIARLTE